MKVLNKKFETLLLESPAEGILNVTLSRPEVRNALNTKMAKELSSLLADCQAESKLRVLVLTGSEDKAFCAGADLKERNSMDMAAWKEQHFHFEAVIGGLANLKAPVIASVNGVAFGGGLEIILASDFAYVVEGSRFSFSEVKLGIIPGLGGMYRLSKLVGPARAKELVCSGSVFSSEEGCSWGVFNKVVSSSQLEKETLELAKQISVCAPLAVSAAKEAIDLAAGADLKSWTEEEHRLYYSLVESEDRKEGIAAFNEKRVAKFNNK